MGIGSGTGSGRKLDGEAEAGSAGKKQPAEETHCDEAGMPEQRRPFSSPIVLVLIAVDFLIP
jgi:hypothetical protein